MIRCLFRSVLFVLVTVTTTYATGQVTFTYKFPEGHTVTSKIVNKTSQTLTLADTKVLTGSDQSMSVTSTNGHRAADGTLAVKSRISTLRTTLRIGDTEITFDSIKPDASAADSRLDAAMKLLKATARSSWQSTLNSDNQVVSVTGRDASLADLPKETRDSMKSRLDPEYLRTLENEDLARLPTTPVSPGRYQPATRPGVANKKRLRLCLEVADPTDKKLSAQSMQI